MSKFIYWQGSPVPFVPGETIAATLARNGCLTDGKTNGSPWRVFCGIGNCQQCVVLIDNARVVEACLTLASAGMRIEPLLQNKEVTDHV